MVNQCTILSLKFGQSHRTCISKNEELNQHSSIFNHNCLHLRIPAKSCLQLLQFQQISKRRFRQLFTRSFPNNEFYIKHGTKHFTRQIQKTKIQTKENKRVMGCVTSWFKVMCSYTIKLRPKNIYRVSGIRVSNPLRLSICNLSSIPISNE